MILLAYIGGLTLAIGGRMLHHVMITLQTGITNLSYKKYFMDEVTTARLP